MRVMVSGLDETALVEMAVRVSSHAARDCLNASVKLHGLNSGIWKGSRSI